MPITISGLCRSIEGTTLDKPKHVGHSLPKKGGRDVARKVIHAKNRRNSEIEI
jgi:hypothetical protein